MSSQLPEDLSSFSMLDLFKAEAETQQTVLTPVCSRLKKPPRPSTSRS